MALDRPPLVEEGSFLALRGEWYRGSKYALAEQREPATFARFAAALAPDASFELLEALVDDVSG